jgi:hypothetical protein
MVGSEKHYRKAHLVKPLFTCLVCTEMNWEKCVEELM